MKAATWNVLHGSRQQNEKSLQLVIVTESTQICSLHYARGLQNEKKHCNIWWQLQNNYAFLIGSNSFQDLFPAKCEASPKRSDTVIEERFCQLCWYNALISLDLNSGWNCKPPSDRYLMSESSYLQQSYLNRQRCKALITSLYNLATKEQKQT